MGETDKFVLRWNDFEKNIVSAYKDLRTDKDFFDCSLVSSGRTFQAHRVILAACSPVFRDMIRSDPGTQNIWEAPTCVFSLSSLQTLSLYLFMSNLKTS